MKKWKKNVRKIPLFILGKLEQIQSNDIIVSCAKQISLSDIQNGLYEHVGLSMNGSSLHFENSLMPRETVGRYSRYNINGRTIIRRDLPKITVSYSADVPNFGDWSKGSHEITWTREVYQRDNQLPKLLSINIELLENSSEMFIFKFSIDTILSKNDDAFLDDLLFHCNVLQENIGQCDIFAEDSSKADYIKTLYVDWELFPPGNREIAATIMSTFHNPSQQVEDVINERIEFFETLNIRTYIRAINRFNLYFGAILKNDLVILENVRYGNAVYIFKKNWEELSKLSRTELLKIQSKDFIRVLHNSNWKNNVLRAITEAF